MGINWTFPYFSGAANLNTFLKWEISVSDFNSVKSIFGGAYDLSEYKYYKHQRVHDTILNTTNNYGYVLVVWLSQKLFPYWGDIQGVVFLQIFVHIFASFFAIFCLIKKQVYRVIFIILYSANPLIIHFVTFPFYYFWMFIPSLLFASVVMRKEWMCYLLLLSVPILLLSVFIRPTTFFISILIFIYAFINFNDFRRRMLSVTLLVVFLLGVFFISKNSTASPWHTMYIGVGAYKNNLGVADLGDNRGYEYFLHQTGVLINTDAVSGNYNDPEVRGVYMQSLKERYLDMIFEDPFQLIKNAIENGVKVFTIGYLVRYPNLSWLVNIQGILFIAFLIYLRQYVWFLAVLSTAIGFFWYFPPVPAYNFGAYVLLVLGFMSGMDKVYRKIPSGN